MCDKKERMMLTQDEKFQNGKTMKILEKKIKGCIPFYKVQCVHISEPKWISSKQIKDKGLIIDYENEELNQSESMRSNSPIVDDLNLENNKRVLRRRKRVSFANKEDEISKNKKRKNTVSPNNSTRSPTLNVRRRIHRSCKAKSSIKTSETNEHYVEETYAVERIIEHKMFDNIKMYKVRWENYGPEHDSWLTIEDFNDINFVLKYEEECEKKKLQVDGDLNNDDFLKKILRKSMRGFNYGKDDIHGIICQMKDENMDGCYLVQLSNGELVCIYPENIPEEMYDEALQSMQYKLEKVVTYL